MIHTIASFMVLVALPAVGDARPTVAYTCNMDGQAGRLEAKYQTVDLTGQPTTLPRETITENIAARKVKVFFTGTLKLDDRDFVFSGADHIAEFTDVETKKRFLAHVVRKDGTLTVTRNPNSASSSAFLCVDD